MKTNRVFLSPMVLIAALSISGLTIPRQAKAQGTRKDFCGILASGLQSEAARFQNNSALTNEERSQEIRKRVRDNFVNIVNAPSCFFQANISNPSTSIAIAPARTSLWNVFGSLSGSQQQGSSLSSTGSTNAVSKPSGQSAMSEEFGGFNASSGTSSLTLQWSPGTTFTDLTAVGFVQLCIDKNLPKGCISPSVLKGLAPLTLKVTGNTSSSGQSLTGTAATPGSTAPAQQVTVSSKGNSGPGFGGITVQYSIMGSKSKAAAAALTDNSKSSSAAGKKAGASPTDAPPVVKQYVAEAKLADQTYVDLDQCDIFKAWKSSAEGVLTEQVGSAPARSQNEVQTAIENQYTSLLTNMVKSTSCRAALQDFREFFAAILEAKTYEDFQAQKDASKTPEVALEYDLNTPQNKPSYSSAKATFTYSFGNRNDQGSANSKKGDASPGSKAQNEVHQYAKAQVDAMTSAPPGSHSTQQTTANAKPEAEANTAPWSLTMTGAADVYNAAPPSSVPSSSHLRDIQAGAEIAYLFSPTDKSGAIRQLIGDVTAAAAYSYQDQTSPAILTGAALNDFAGLPSSTTTAYAKRGVIHLGQVRLGFGKGGNTSFPLAFTYSNRTELVVHPTWGLQFGISYNLTSLFGSPGAARPASTSGDK